MYTHSTILATLLLPLSHKNVQNNLWCLKSFPWFIFTREKIRGMSVSSLICVCVTTPQWSPREHKTVSMPVQISASWWVTSLFLFFLSLSLRGLSAFHTVSALFFCSLSSSTRLRRVPSGGSVQCVLHGFHDIVYNWENNFKGITCLLNIFERQASKMMQNGVFVIIRSIWFIYLLNLQSEVPVYTEHTSLLK